ncbi:hypothetical protein ACFYOT_25195 [Saccharothrix saharensis]|uniref:hypothetical protein n=1 Tax=Saccharothrix saharensis TaxID=571190 RepID=UPI00369EC742
MRMMFDDDTGKRPHLQIRSEDRPISRSPAPRPPSKRVRELILEHRHRHKWGPERIHKHFRVVHGRHDISLRVIRLVLEQNKKVVQRH